MSNAHSKYASKSASPSAARKATNLSVSAELLARAREHGINLSATLEKALIAAVQEKERELWLAENRPAIAAYNELVDAQGVFSDGVRGF